MIISPLPGSGTPPPPPFSQTKLYFSPMNCKMGFWDLRPRGWNLNARRLVSVGLLNVPTAAGSTSGPNWRKSSVFSFRTFRIILASLKETRAHLLAHQIADEAISGAEEPACGGLLIVHAVCAPASHTAPAMWRPRHAQTPPDPPEMANWLTGTPETPANSLRRGSADEERPRKHLGLTENPLLS